ncbi:MAG TPA: hypothetical protein VFO66_06905 [Gemmatimonadaceae bacterium]|nr:hypothetical protein [Gemmatimonadaceae bacterium]
MIVQIVSAALLLSGGLPIRAPVPSTEAGPSGSGAIDRTVSRMSDSLGSGISGKLKGPFFRYLTQRPFAAKVNGRIGNYLIGFWPAEKNRVTSLAYRNPERFIEVTPANQETPVSEHFRIRDFLTKGQANVWPKYLVLDERLVDKLELVIDDLNTRGIVVRHVQVMSGFRTPSYNGPGGEGRSGVSRHMYGDAADVFVDNDRNGRMDDLNRDGRVDHRDARVILESVERIERRHPSLAGGVGVYKANAAHGPFAHVDVRGWRARWGLIG